VDGSEDVHRFKPPNSTGDPVLHAIELHISILVTTPWSFRAGSLWN
jgi:hypothetical protein